MRIVKRTYYSLKSYVDVLLNEIQNHDELSRAAIRELSGKIATARLEFERLKKHRVRLEKDLTETETAVTAWQERAVDVESEDREKAIVCLKRKKKAEARKKVLDQELQAIKQVETKIAASIDNLNQALCNAKNKRQILLAKEAQTQAATSSVIDTNDVIENVFSSWEEKLLGQELQLTPVDTDFDELDQEFLEKEEKADLEAELDSLIGR